MTASPLALGLGAVVLFYIIASIIAALLPFVLIALAASVVWGFLPVLFPGNPGASLEGRYERVKRRHSKS